MKLYNVPRNSQVRVTHDIPEAGLKDGDIIQFSHIDGMYSYCESSDGNTIHLIASLEVDLVASLN